MASIPAHLVFGVSQASLRQSRLLNSNCARPAEDFTKRQAKRLVNVSDFMESWGRRLLR
jgi:hypothetical protein